MAAIAWLIYLGIVATTAYVLLIPYLMGMAI